MWWLLWESDASTIHDAGGQKRVQYELSLVTRHGPKPASAHVWLQEIIRIGLSSDLRHHELCLHHSPKEVTTLSRQINWMKTILIYFLAFLPYVSLHLSCSSRWTYDLILMALLFSAIFLCKHRKVVWLSKSKGFHSFYESVDCRSTALNKNVGLTMLVPHVKHVKPGHFTSKSVLEFETF